MDLRHLAVIGLCGMLIAGYCGGQTLGQTRLTPAEAAARAQERFDGAVLDVEQDRPGRDENADEVYEVRLLTKDNAIIRIRINAVTGAFLEAAGDNLIPAIKRPSRPQ